MDDDLQIDRDEDLFRNPVYYEPAGRNLDLDRPDLGVPRGQDLLNVLLRRRGRFPVEKRGLICPDCRDLRGRRVPQLSAQTGRGMRAREGFRRRGGIQSVWDFADPDDAGIGTVPYVRTPNLPASVIRVQKNPVAVQDGNFVLEEGQCSQNGALTRCPEKPYDPENPTDAGCCGGWHRVLVPAHQSSTFTGEGGLTLTQFIVEAAAGERIPFQRGGATTVGSPHSSGSSASRRRGPPWTKRSASQPYDRGTGATGAPRTVRLRRCGLNRSRDVAAARSSLSPAPGKPRPPEFRSMRGSSDPTLPLRRRSARKPSRTRRVARALLMPQEA